MDNFVTATSVIAGVRRGKGCGDDLSNHRG